MIDLVQHIVVTLFALGAGVVIVRRVLGVVGDSKKSGCESCASNQGACAPTASDAAPTHHVAVLIRRPSSQARTH